MGNKERDLARRGTHSGKGVGGREISWKILNTVTKNSILHAILPHDTPITWSQISWLFCYFLLMFQLKKSYVVAWNVVVQARVEKVLVLRLNPYPANVENMVSF